jgi:TonB-linked SusC/RagA family outer membrane protein
MSMRRLRRLASRVAVAAAAIAGVAWSSATAQSGATISGRVLSESGSPIASATVAITSLGVGAQTDANGRYSFAVPAGRVAGQSAQLVARSLGFKPSTTTITLTPGPQSHNFALAANPLRLGEVVVTGSGTTAVRERLGTASSTVQAVDVGKSGERNLSSALAAKAPGVSIVSGAGDPGAGTQVFIRGIKTIEGDGQPLFVIDGMPVDNTSQATNAGVISSNRLSDLNPNDVENMEILSGPSATMIYGQRGANGVILITTKSGRAGATRYSWQTGLNVDDVNREIPLQTRYTVGNLGTLPACNYTSLTPGCLNRGRNWGPELAAGTQVYDHFGELFRQARNLDNNLTISGGDQSRSFFLSLGATNQQGIIIGPNSFMNRYNVRMKGTQALGSKWRVGGNIGYTQNNLGQTQRGSNLSGLLLGATRTAPDFNQFPYLNELGGHRSYRRPNPLGGQDAVYDNPLFVVNEHKNRSDVNRAIGNITVDYDPFSWLKFNYTLGTDYFNDQRLTGLPPESSGSALTGELTQGTITNLQIDHNLLATGTKRVNDWMELTTTLGQNINTRQSRTNQVFGRGYIGTGIFTLNNLVSTNFQAQNFESKINLIGLFAQQEVNLWDQLYLRGTIRRDQASTYGPGFRSNVFPGANVAWNATRWVGNGRGPVSYLKVRAAYGQTGREPNPYQFLTFVTSAAQGTSFGTGTANASQAGFGGLYTAGNRGAPNLGPEITEETEGGFDFAFFNSRIDGSLTFYNTTTDDAIIPIPVPQTTGFNGQRANGAVLRNNGTELQINTRVIDRPNLRGELGFLFSRNRSRTVSLAGGVTFIGVPGAFAPGTNVVGEQIGVFYSSDVARCRLGTDDADNTVQGIDINAACRTAGAPDGAMYIDSTGFPVQDDANRLVGDPNPNWIGNLRAGITLYKKLQISALLDLRRGGDVYNGTRGALYHFGTWKETENRATCTATGCTGNERVFGSTILPGNAVFGPGAGRSVAIGENYYHDGEGGGGGIFTGVTGPLLEDGSWTRLREVSISYSFASDWLRNTLGLSSADVRLGGRNLFLSTKYTGIDPETSYSGASSLDRGSDYFNNPQTRSFILSVSLNR